jgi:hypothetical protein
VRDRLTLRLLLKRGALLAAANWPVVAVQFVADAAFKIVLTIPVLGGTLLVVLLLGGNAAELLNQGIRTALSDIAAALVARPVALVFFLLAFLIALLGGSVFMFLIKGGTITVLAAGDRIAGPLEKGPWRLDSLRRASAFSSDRFIDGCSWLFRRYLTLGIGLMIAYAISGALYLAVVISSYQVASYSIRLVGWTMMAAIISSAFVVWITIMNLIYLLAQIAVAMEDLSVRAALGRVAQFLRADLREVAGVFGTVLVMVVLTTAASLLATAGVGLVAFVPIVGFAVFPLQAAAWLVRSLVFQYVGLTALCAYLRLYRAFAFADRVGPQPVWSNEVGSPRTA